MARILTSASWLPAAVLTILAAAPPSPAVAAGDPSKGRVVFATQCAACHSNARGGPVILGPPLYGVVGRKAGSVTGFSYSQTMKQAGFIWNADQLRAYLPAPRQYLPGVRMTYPGLHDPQRLEDLIAYLQDLR